MTKCLECGSEIKQTEGRRPRKFCDNKGKCKGAYWIKNKPKEPRYVLKSTLDSVVAKYESILLSIPSNAENPQEAKMGLHVMALAMASMGNGDSKSKTSPQEEIEKYESEIKTLGDSALGKRRKVFLEGKIRELKNNI